MPDAEGLNRREFVTEVGLGAGGLSALANDRDARSRGRPRVAAAMTADDFGIVGDGVADETIKVQAFLDACAAAGSRTAHFGGKRVRITGPLFARSVGIVFDGFGYGDGNDPGFYVSGAGFTALTVTGAILDFAATVAGSGSARLRVDGSVISDDRPRVDGIAFGSPDESQPLGLSLVRFARVFKLSGCGIRHTACWDSVFQSLSVEECGSPTKPAFEVSRVEYAKLQRKRLEPLAGRAVCRFGNPHSS